MNTTIALLLCCLILALDGSRVVWASATADQTRNEGHRVEEGLPTDLPTGAHETALPLQHVVRQLKFSDSNNSVSKPATHQLLTQQAAAAQGRMSIAILTAATINSRKQGAQTSAQHLRMIYASLKNKYHYCELHGYHLLPILWTPHTDVPGAWAKTAALQKHLPGYDWIWVLDLDAWITNMTITLEEHVFAKMSNPNADIIVAKDRNCLNSGSMFVRNSEWSLQVFSHVWEMRHKNDSEVGHISEWWEQAALAHYLSHNLGKGEEAKHIEYFSAKAINAFPEVAARYAGATWAQGDFVLHTAGLRAKKFETAGNLAPHVLYNDSWSGIR